MTVVTRAALLAHARKATTATPLPADPVYRRAAALEIKLHIDEEMTADFIISDATVDRMGDVVDPAGWDLTAYAKNPVVLWGHDHALMPIARAENVRVEDGKLKARAVFDPNDARAVLAFQKIAGGFINATSVGFIPREFAPATDKARPYGIDFKSQELIEFSLVSVPANPAALVEDSVEPFAAPSAPASPPSPERAAPAQAMGARLRLRARSHAFLNG